MSVNLIFLIAAAAILVLAFVFCAVNKPRKPLFTGTTLIILLVFLLATEIINMGLSTPTVIALPQGFVSAVSGFLTAQTMPTAAQLEQAFAVYMYIDIALVVICVISLIIEVRSIFTTAPKKTDEQSKKREETKE